MRVGMAGQKRAREHAYIDCQCLSPFPPPTFATKSHQSPISLTGPSATFYSLSTKTTSHPLKPYTSMFASRVILQARVAPTLTRSVTTIARDAAPKVSSSSNAAAISTTATAKAAVNSDKHTRDFGGRLISKNRTYHQSTSWEGSDMPVVKQMTQAEERRRKTQFKNAMDF
ncbi:hypothetical protein BCV69DRAFT_281383 [Microstroma glucosiphilum]|uniref:Uncharacterized protein n=1 Tax=Pseudomicrostroma glucosiphilum TaxID=1684307 RepID=A0A316UDA2_9BASI|nr:hypothetical protein BCV69DRAFT_281383 [Pseudomicrostroma glucosiphilum]PWN22381.1 hypothetical protein BCV69DRAFT_281383 [Pseudomicrostroma glucosiphilum]